VKQTKYRTLLIVAILLACGFALWPTYRAYQLDTDRKAAALQGDSTLARWDSIHGANYRESLRNFLAFPIKLGLDLQGGMYVTMEVDIPGLLYESAQREAVDEAFEQVIAATRKEAALSDEPVIEIFMRNFNAIAAPQGKTLLNYYDVGDLGGNVNDDAVLQRLTRNIEDAVDQGVEVVRQRIDKYGLSETTIQKVAGRRIVLELPGVTDAEGVRSLIQTTARLEFKLVKNNADAVRLFQRIDRVLAGKVTNDEDSTATPARDTAIAAGADSTRGDSTIASADGAGGMDTAAGPTAVADSSLDTADPYAGLTDEQKIDSIRKDHPFTTLFQTLARMSEDAQPQDAFGAYFMKNVPDGIYEFFTSRSGMQRMKALLARSDVRAVIPEDVVIAFSAHPEFGGEDDETATYGIYVLPAESELTGEAVADARADFDPQTGRPVVMMGMSVDGAEKWADITGRNIKKRIAIVLDSAVYSAPVVQGRIAGGSSQITGSKDVKEANLLAVVLKAGALKAPVHIIEERIVGPSLGEDSINQGITATLFAALLVVLFMLVYYSFGGFIADVAVMFNVLMTLAILAAFNATLTLPGIGGLVLTIGMAVDGNILIYERIREELAAGRSLKSAVQLGFEKAFAAILDSNVTTFMTGVILFLFGSGPISGFAITLMIGIAATLFTSVFLSRTIFMLMLDRGTTSINFGQPKNTGTVAAA